MLKGFPKTKKQNKEIVKYHPLPSEQLCPLNAVLQVLKCVKWDIGLFLSSRKYFTSLRDEGGGSTESFLKIQLYLDMVEAMD